MQKLYIITVILEAKPGKELELKQALMDVVEPHRREKACLEYRLHQDLNNPAQFVIYARWTSEEEHDKELKKPYVIALLKRLDEELLAKPLQAFSLEEL